MEAWKKKKIMLHSKAESVPVKIVGDAAIASQGIGEGRMIPLVIIDTSTRPDIEEFANVHKFSPPGDVESSWAKLSRNKDSLCLVLSFHRPSRFGMIIEFDIVKQGIIIDQIVNSQALYIQPGREGDRLKNTIDNPRILVEIPSRSFEKEWNKLYLSRLIEDFKKAGISPKNAREAGKKLIEESRMIQNFRMKRSKPHGG